jgi:hypothetical protein
VLQSLLLSAAVVAVRLMSARRLYSTFLNDAPIGGLSASHYTMARREVRATTRLLLTSALLSTAPRPYAS